MKKALFSALAAAGLCIHSSVWAQPVAGASTAAAGMSAAGASGVTAAVTERVSRDSIPELLAGIWQGSDRLLFFGKDGSDFAAVLRVFYGWYADRAAEPASYAELSTRPRNDATATPAQHISLRYVTVAENASRTAGAYELEVQYPGLKEPVLVPVAVIDGKLYMDFLVRGSAQYTDSQNSLGNAPAAGSGSGGGVREIPSADGYWRDCGAAGGLTVSPPVIDDELVGYYFADGAYYHIRYWLTDMPYSYDRAGFTDGDRSYSVDKYMRVAGRVYTCATGRRTQIRNIAKSADLPPHVFDSDSVICAFGQPYLVRVDGEGSRESLEALVAENNARRAPAPKPLFPPVQPTVRWPDIEHLDLYNPSTWNRRNLDVGK